MADNAQLIAQCEARAKEWLSPAFDEETRKEVQAMLDAEDIILKQIDFDQTKDFSLLCSEDVYNTLFNNGNVRNLVARAGIEDIDYWGFSATYTIQVKNAVKFTVPYTYAKDQTQFLEAYNEFHNGGTSEFYIITTPSIYNDLIENDYEKLYELQALGQVNAFQWSGNSYSASFHYTDTDFVDVPCIPCDSRDSIV